MHHQSTTHHARSRPAPPALLPSPTHSSTATAEQAHATCAGGQADRQLAGRKAGGRAGRHAGRAGERAGGRPEANRQAAGLSEDGIRAAGK